MAKRRPFGSVRKLPSGRFQARYRDAQNVRRAAPSTFDTEAAAWDWLVGTEADIIRGTWRDPDAGRVTFAEWAGEYMAGAVHKRPRTRYKDESILRRRLMPVWGEMAIADIEQRHVQAFINVCAAKYAPSTVETEYSLFRSIMAAAVNADLIERTPCRGINMPEPKSAGEKRRVSIEELAALADHVHKRYRAMIWLTGLMGLRWSEVAGLTVGRIGTVPIPSITVDQALADVGGRVELDRTKSRSSERTLPMPPILKVMLDQHLAAEGRSGQLDAFVFTSPRGGPLRYSDFHDTVWAPAVGRAGLDGLTFHGLRHSSGGLLRQLGQHTQLIARWLGHADDRLTSRVYGWVPDAVDVAAATALNEALGKALELGSGHVGGTDEAAVEGA
jgi:integrase